MVRRATLAPRDRPALDTFVPRVRETLGDNLVALKLFGSKASGRDTTESDIDVLVLMRKTDAGMGNRVLDIAFGVNLATRFTLPRVSSLNPYSAIRFGTTADLCKHLSTRWCLCEARSRHPRS
jgi:predicted nucleotidyltransferase